MGSIGKVESLEEILASPPDVYSVITDINLAQMWGRTGNGGMIYPQDPRMKLGHIIEVQPKGMKQPFKLKIRVMHHEEFVEMEVIDGPLFGNFKFELNERPYGTLISAAMDYRIESMAFNIKWKMSEKKKFKQMLDGILVNVKGLSEQRSSQQ